MTTTSACGDVESRVLAVVREVFAVERDDLSVDSSIKGDLAADSLDQLTLVMALEDEFGGAIPEEEVSRLVTLRDVVDCISARISAASAK